jgi:hypothetical protein
MSEEHEADESAEADDAPRELDDREVEVDGGDLPKFDPVFDLERWDTAEGPVIGLRYDGPDIASPADRVAYVRAAMEHGDA